MSDYSSREFKNQGVELKSLAKPLEELVPNIQPVDPNFKPVGTFFPTACSYGENFYRKLIFPNFDWKKMQALDFCREVKDQILVDLGAGANLYGYQVACLLGAKVYVGVEPLNFNNLSKTFEASNSLDLYIGFKNQPIPYALVPQDALSFLRRLPPRSVSLMSNGIDLAVIQGDEYYQSLAGQAARVIEGKGAFIQYGSKIINPGQDFVESEYDAGDIGDLRKFVRRDLESY